MAKKRGAEQAPQRGGPARPGRYQRQSGDMRQQNASQEGVRSDALTEKAARRRLRREVRSGVSSLNTRLDAYRLDKRRQDPRQHGNSQ